MKIVTISLTLLVIALFSASSCTPSVPQEEYDRISDELSTMQAQLATVQDELVEAGALATEIEELTRQYDIKKDEYDSLRADYEGLDKEYEELDEQYNAMKGEYDSLQAEHQDLSIMYADLTTEYEELIETHEASLEETDEIINEEALEQAIFNLVNQERKAQGLDELLWGKYLYKRAKSNSTDMAIKQQLEYVDYGSYQEVYRVTGYTTTEKMSEAVWTIWKDTNRYESTFLNSVMVYGAVAAYKSGEIFYLTYICDYFK